MRTDLQTNRSVKSFMAAELHIAIQPETLFHIGGFEVTNTLFTSYLISALLILFLAYARSKIKYTDRPTGLQNVLEMIVQNLTSFVEGIAGKGKQAATFLPVIAGFFLFIVLNNWAELVPGFHTIVYTGKPGIHLTQVPALPEMNKVFAATETPTGIDANLTEVSETGDIVELEGEYGEVEEEHKGVALLRGAHADLNMTLALALISVGLTQYYGLKFVGPGYLKKFFNFSSPIFFFVGLLELISEFSKIMSFGFRLFGNIFAGEVLIAVISFLVPVILPIPFYGLEIFVGFIQALVFSMLSLVYFSMAADKHAH